MRFNRLWALPVTISEQDLSTLLTATLPNCEPLFPLYPPLSVAAVCHGATHCRSLCWDLTRLARSVVTDPGVGEAH